MSSAFDPYYKWLGIPPRSQPPHHYRLLAIEPFEDDRDVIEAATARLMAYLKLAANGEHVEHSQKLLNEVAAARRCLLNPEKKAAYDAQLREQLQKAEKPASAAGDKLAAGEKSAAGGGSTAPKAASAKPGAAARPKLVAATGLTAAGAAERETGTGLELALPRRRKKLLIALGGAALVAAAVLVTAMTLVANALHRGPPEAKAIAQAPISSAPATAVKPAAGPRPKDQAPPAPVAAAKVATPVSPQSNPQPPVGPLPPAAPPGVVAKPPLTPPPTGPAPVTPTEQERRQQQLMLADAVRRAIDQQTKGGASLANSSSPADKVTANRGPFAPETKPVKPDEPKPDEPKPTDSKPTEPKPDQPKPTDSKPDEPKPTEAKPGEPKPDEPKIDTRVALHEVLVLLRSKKTDDRVRAMQRLKSLPAAEAAKLAIQPGLEDRAPEVRNAAYQTLLTWKDQREVVDQLLKALTRLGHSKTAINTNPPPPGNLPTLSLLLMVLASSAQRDLQHDLEKFAAGYLTASKLHVATLLEVADELGRQGDPAAVAALRNLCRWQQFSDVFAFRRAVVDALIHCRQVDALDALVDLLGQVDGEVHGDVVQYLAAVTKMPYGDQVDAWKFWWQKRKKDFTFDPPPGAPAPEVVVVPQAQGQGSYSSYYYGLPVRARRLVFVIDVSGSMQGPKLDMAKRELTGAIGKLPTQNSFSIVAFDHRVVVWQRDLVPATPEYKDIAVQYIRRLQAGGGTATYDALDAAAQFDAEAIYFLTDGEPTSGRVVNPRRITALVTEANYLRRLSVYTIGLSPGVVGGIFDTFLQALATQNRGTYQRVDQ